MTSPEPVLIAIVVVQRGSDVLIGRRPPDVPLGGLWEFPGGKLLPGESPDEAARRECREETGLEIRLLTPLQTVDHRYEHGLVRLHFFLAEPLDRLAEPRPPYCWVARPELADYPFPPANRSVLQRLLNS